MKTLKINLKLNNNFEINETTGTDFGVEVVKNPHISEEKCIEISKQNILLLTEDRLAMYRRKDSFPRGLKSAKKEAIEMIKTIGAKA